MHKLNLPKYLICLVLGSLMGFLPFAVRAQAYDETGRCSFYAAKFQGRNTASGEKFDQTLLTAAHRTLPFNTLVKVTNLINNKSVVVRINDRGPNTGNRLIDLSRAAAVSIEMIPYGVVTARVEYVGMANADSVKQFLAERAKEREIKIETAKEPDQTAKKAEVKKPSIATLSNLSPGAFYNQDYKTCSPGGYGIQVGFYKSLSNCRNAMHHFEGKYSVKSFMYVEKKADGYYYRLIIGQFRNTLSAEQFKKNLEDEVPDAFITAYSSL